MSSTAHNCCVGRGCGDCGYCFGDCEECCPRYGSVDWPPDSEEQALRRPLCDCPRHLRAWPCREPGQRSICGRCQGYLYPEGREGEVF